MDADQQKKLRAPFAGGQIGKLPRVTCRDCSQRSCQKHQKQKCSTCGNYISTQHIHLDYVGHAAVTDRLLEADPSWTWEPVAFDEQGLPRLDRNGGLWIRLTVGGVTRLGYGDASGKQGADAVKEAIGDALRNASMRFGVALDLWHKDGDLHADDDQAPIGSGQAPVATQQRSNGAQQARPQPAAAEPEAPPPAAAPQTPDEARLQLRATCKENGWSLDLVAARFKADHGVELKQCTDRDAIVRFRASLFSLSDAALRAPAEAGAR